MKLGIDSLVCFVDDVTVMGETETAVAMVLAMLRPSAPVRTFTTRPRSMRSTVAEMHTYYTLRALSRVHGAT